MGICLWADVKDSIEREIEDEEERGGNCWNTVLAQLRAAEVWDTSGGVWPCQESGLFIYSNRIKLEFMGQMQVDVQMLWEFVEILLKWLLFFQ